MARKPPRLARGEPNENLEEFLLMLPASSKPQQITQLQLQDKALRALPAKLSFLKALRRLSLASNTLVDISSLATVPTLAHLDLANNRVETLKPLAVLKHLTVLNVSHNALTSLGGLEGGPSATLSALIASDNNLADISAIGSCVVLETLVLTRNTHLTNDGAGDAALWTLLGEISSLRKVSLGSCGVVSVPADTSLPKVTELRIGHNKVAAFPPTVKIPSLKILDMPSNHFSSIESVARFRFLQQLNIKGNPVVDASTHPLDHEPTAEFLKGHFELLKTVDGRKFEALDEMGRRRIRNLMRKREQQGVDMPAKSESGKRARDDDDTQDMADEGPLQKRREVGHSAPQGRRERELVGHNEATKATGLRSKPTNDQGLSKEQLKREEDALDEEGGIKDLEELAPRRPPVVQKFVKKASNPASKAIVATGSAVAGLLAKPAFWV